MRVFISHSRRDEGIVNNIYKTLSQAGITPFIAEFEEMGEVGGLTASEIDNELRKSDWVMAFLSPNVIESAHTQSWVSYEIATGHAIRKPIWVFEHEREPVNFPIPYLDYYFLYDPSNRMDWTAIKTEIRKHGKKIDLAPAIVGGILGSAFGNPGALVGALAGLSKASEEIKKMKALPPEGFGKVNTQCQNCKSTYQLIAKYEIMKSGYTCPICRIRVRLS